MTPTTASPTSRSQSPRWWFAPIAFLLSVAIAVALLEVAAGYYFEKRIGASLGKRWVELALYGKSSVPEPKYSAHPYLLYVNRPGADTQVERHGLRGPEAAEQKEPDTIRILFLGGSTVFSVSVTDYRDAWPWQLGEVMREKTGRKIEVLNAGLPYGTTAENLAAYVFRYRYLHPDVVVIESGGNDQVPVWFPRYNPEYTHFRAQGTWWEPAVSKRARFLLHSNFVKVLYTQWLDEHLKVYSMHPHAWSLLDRQEVLQRVRTNKLDGFSRNLDLMVKLAKADGCRVLLVSFLQDKRENLTRNRPELAGMEAALEEGLRRHVQVMEAVAARHGVTLVNPRRAMFTDAMFTDLCHLTAAGEKVKAAEVAPALTALIPEP